MLPQIAAFEAVVRLGNATRAAEALCIAQPTLSGHLRKLSEALGVRLFELQGKRLVPTDAALVLLQTTHEVFAALERCEQTLTSLRTRYHLGECATEPVQPGIDAVASAGWLAESSAVAAAPHATRATKRTGANVPA
jgi:DNA-binding transcriptional LysR family regulator